MASFLGFNNKKSIAFPIIIGYGLVVVISILTAIFSIVSNNNKGEDESIIQVQMPLFYNMKDLSILISTSRNLSKNWVFQPNVDEKKQLTELLNVNYPQLKQKIQDLTLKLEDQKEKTFILQVLADYDKVHQQEINITNTLAVDSNYSNDIIIDKAITIFEKKCRA